MLPAVVRSVWYPFSRIEVLNNMYKTAVFIQKEMGRRWRTHGPLTLFPLTATGHDSELNFIIVILHSLRTINLSMIITFYCRVSHDIFVSSCDLSSDPSKTQPPQHPPSVFASLRKRKINLRVNKRMPNHKAQSCWCFLVGYIKQVERQGTKKHRNINTVAHCWPPDFLALCIMLSKQSGRWSEFLRAVEKPRCKKLRQWCQCLKGL